MRCGKCGIDSVEVLENSKKEERREIIEELKRMLSELRPEARVNYPKAMLISDFIDWLEGRNKPGPKAEIATIDTSGPFGGDWGYLVAGKMNELIRALNELKAQKN